MEDIELVIKIPEEQYNMILLSDKTVMAECASKEAMMYAIKNGTPLPKGHGRLIDADDLDLKRIDIILSGEVKDTVDALSKMGMLIIIAPTVIEADEAESEVQDADTETWNGYHGQVTAPKGTFKRIYADTDGGDAE